jgi:hypothetical protein
MYIANLRESEVKALAAANFFQKFDSTHLFSNTYNAVIAAEREIKKKMKLQQPQLPQSPAIQTEKSSLLHNTTSNYSVNSV